MLMLVGLRWPLRHDPLQEEEEGMATQVLSSEKINVANYLCSRKFHLRIIIIFQETPQRQF